ncbi:MULTISPECIES: hypothetical protein [unclassified Gemella]|uniref:hypothetical protein n=1 Tax=unclassified Gemella TaxID=2624949 RepID=UPI001073AAE5|nr:MULTISPECIES: hypothetical protein [unclassified Gemella]MBF0710827.1 hypothetical protein [Gemella sp. GL1.1]NYS28171.1 hypothetical protein [Gemella sp. GL1]TFU60370.1 hypothetical protein E4T67_00065 [Gemella sp. WT2a]
MFVAFIAFLIFVVSFIILGATYMILISFNMIKKKRLEKVARLIAVYSLFVTLVYVFQYVFM